MAGLLCGCHDGCAAAQNDQVSKRNLLAAGLCAVEILLDHFQLAQDLGQFSRLVDFPVFLRRQAYARAVCSTALVAAAERRSRRPSRGDQLGDGKPGCKDLGLQGGDVLLIDQLVVHCWNGVLPQQLLLRN